MSYMINTWVTKIHDKYINTSSIHSLFKNSKNSTGKVEKDVEHDATIAWAQESLKSESKCERYG